MHSFISEDQIEKEAVKILVDKLGYRTLNCHTTDVENINDNSKRQGKQEVVLLDILKEKALIFYSDTWNKRYLRIDLYPSASVALEIDYDKYETDENGVVIWD